METLYNLDKRMIHGSNLADHAGFIYEWFESVVVNEDGSLTITAASETSDPKTVTATSDDIHTALREYILADLGGTCGREFALDLLTGQFRDADGDTNIVDTIYQLLMWGEEVYG